MINKSNETFDYIFIGMGAANSLLILEMDEKDLLRNKKIGIIEPSKKNVNDRNFCFWSSEEEVLKLNLEDLISSKWQQIKVSDRKNQSISPLYYYHIRGIDVYKKVKEKLKVHQAFYFHEVFNCEPHLNSESFIIHLSDSKIISNKVFDSRPPTYESAKKNQSHLLQSFYGWEIKTNDYIFDKSTVGMMDFNIPQNNYCQFVYVLPFTENTALVEVTRFGKESITKEESEKLLNEYVARFSFSYQILEEERGVIPMSNLKISNVNYGKNWVYTGARASMIKSTTGYAFHNMAVDANRLSGSMNSHQTFERKKNPKRFKYYDRLLLKILEETPHHGKKIFQHLFKQQSITEVLSFLSEKSSLRNEFIIFSKLPILLFLRAALKDITFRFSNIPPSSFAFVITIFSVFLFTFHLSVILWVFLGFGFLSIGLSHGSLDHLTENIIIGQKQYVTYILKFLVKGALLGFIWLLQPDIAFIIFITFSAWHFGQTDFKEWNQKQGFPSFLWGLIVLFTILFFHLKETIDVLQQIEGLQIHHVFKDLTLNQILVGKISIGLSSLLFIAYFKSKRMLLTFSYLIISTLLPLLASFGIYFIAQHSFHGWRHLKNNLKMSTYRLWLKSLPFSSGGALLFILLFFIDFTNYIGMFFILLSCISLPHVFSMHHFYGRFKENLVNQVLDKK